MSYVNKDCDVTMLSIIREKGGATRARRGGATSEERGGETRCKGKAPTESVKNSEQNNVTTSNAPIGYFHLTDMRIRVREASL